MLLLLVIISFLNFVGKILLFHIKIENITFTQKLYEICVT